MYFNYQRRYRGPVRAVILDWAGTTVDFGSLAPVAAFTRLFAEQGIALSAAEARGPMGMEKREHIRQLCHLPAIQDHAQLIPGCRETVVILRERGIRIGANTGYSRDLMEPLMRVAADQGYVPDSAVCATEVPRGRPYPHMSLRNFIELEVETVQACVKVDDTVPGIEEGLNAGMWTVGVAVSGNEVGLSLADWQALPLSEQQRQRDRAYQRLLAGGAHSVIDTVADLPRCLDVIEAWLARGERP
jgi:phosphonoacetaldehyde hydrolase